MSNFCYTNKTVCDDATSNGYCSLTACRNLNLLANTIQKRQQINWHTGTPTEEGWYLVEIDGYPYAPYHVCSWMDNKWFYTNVFFKDAPIIRWLLISTKESR